MNFCRNDASHKNWYGALFCGHCGARMWEKIVHCKKCGHDVIGGNDVVSGWGTNFCTLCGADRTHFEVTVRPAGGRADLLPAELRRQLNV